MGGLALSGRSGGTLAANQTASLVETALTIIAIVALLPAFAALADATAGRDRRFADAAVTVRGLPDPVLPPVCQHHGALAEPLLRERLCRGVEIDAAQPLERLPQVLIDAAARARQAFVGPLDEAQTRLAALRLQQREGVGDLLVSGDAIQALDAEVQPFVKRFVLDGPDGVGPTPLHCTLATIEAEFQHAASGDGSHVARGNAILLLGAALDGHGAAPALANAALLPVSGIRRPSGCPGAGLADELVRLAALMAGARQAAANAQKSEAMRSLLTSAGWQWAAWMLLGLGLVKLSRREIAPVKGVALALAVWAVAAWIGRVPWPLAADRAFTPGRADAGWLAPPAAFVGGLLVAALLLLVLSRPLSLRPPSTPQTMASRAGYPGLVLATGIGWSMLLDLSANGHMTTRYLALYHQGHLWLALLVFSTLLFVRQPLARLLGWSLSLIDDLAHSVVRWLGSAHGKAAMVLVVLALIWAGGALLSNLRQLTSEVGRVWLIVGAAWFFFLRGGPLAERLARAPGSIGSLVRYTGPLLFVAFVLVAWMVVTRDMGPLLIAAYGAGAFLAASAAMWWHQRRGAGAPAFVLAVVLFVAWIAVLTVGLFQLGAVDEVTAARLESVAAPLASANDQLALVTWFRQAAPASGFGLGTVPWCGHASTGCSGVPVQIHSDYTFTAMVGAFGETGAWAITLACSLWLHRLIRHHGRVTRGEPRLVRTTGRIATDDQAFVSWLCVAWVVLTLCQLAVTVAGNLAVLPLTGVTFPFVSFGMTSLLVNMALLALCLNVNLPPGGRRG